MDVMQFYAKENEKPLDNLVSDGGMCAIFRTIACIGDSLSSGALQSLDDEGNNAHHDIFYYSWGQYMARAMGNTVYNFSKGGMTAKAYCEDFAEQKGFWNLEKAAQCYIIALGVNDVSGLLRGEIEMGDETDIDLNDWRNNKKTIIGYYGRIIQRYKKIQPKGRFFLMTMPHSEKDKGSERAEKYDLFREIIYKVADMFDFTYVIDLREYSPVHDAAFFKYFMLGGHMNPAGYQLTAKMVMSYIDYIIRNNPEDFTQAGFIGTPWHNVGAKW